MEHESIQLIGIGDRARSVCSTGDVSNVESSLKVRMNTYMSQYTINSVAPVYTMQQEHNGNGGCIDTPLRVLVAMEGVSIPR
jgi:hypothetical protein